MRWLFLPLGDEDVLVTGERVLYRRRRHWAAMAVDFWQLIAVVFLRIAFAFRDVRGMGTLLIVGVVLSLIVLRPIVAGERRWGTKELLFVAAAVLVVIGAELSFVGLANALVLFMFGRFLLRVLRWAWFQRLYLTDRRLMEIDGFFGIKVNSMPLAQVTDVMLKRSPIGELLGYGSFRVESAGQDQALGHLDYLLEPEAFHDLVVANPSWTG